MPGVTKKTELQKSRRSAHRVAAEDWSYPTGMVWCPMKMSGMAIMKCAKLQSELGCGSLRQLKMISANAGTVPFLWPWLRRNRECRHRAGEEEIHELLQTVSPPGSIDKSRKSTRVHPCPTCGGRKAFAARQCRRCWRDSVRS
jgi:hypothetical protein